MAALPLASVVTVVEPIGRLPLAKARGVGNQAGEELDQERVLGRLLAVCLEFRCVGSAATAVVSIGSSEGCWGHGRGGMTLAV